MATSLDSVIDMALIIIRDYKLDALYESDAESFQTVLEGYMLKGLPKFEVSCMKTLNYNLSKILSITDFKDGIAIQRDNKQKTVLILRKGLILQCIKHKFWVEA